MAAIAGGTALGGLPVHAAQAPAGTAAPKNDLVKGYCPFCQVRCTYHARVRNGKILELIGDRGNRWTGGAMCPKGLSIVELLNSPYRLVQPMLKQGSEWKTISYAEAVDIVVDKLRQSRAKHGDKIAERLALTSPLWDCRESELAALMTMRTAGGVNVMPAGEVCISTASNVLGMLLGANTSTTTVNEIVNAKTLVLWGANISETYPPYTRWLDKARDAGVRILSVDCRKTPTSAWAADQLMPLPGTDGALALGAIRFVLENGAFDRARVDESITGFELMEKGDALLQAYSGAYVIESFNPAAVNWYKENRPEVCRGQLSWWPQGEEKPSDPASLAKEYAAGALIFDWISRPDFVAYDWHGGNSPQVRLARFMGAVPVSWTVRSRDELAQCDDWFDHHIFEAFVPDEQ